jgi:hypothetical protein
MVSKNSVKWMAVSLFLFHLLFACAAPVQVRRELPPFPDGFLGAKWGSSLEEVKKAIDKDGNHGFQDSTSQYPYALYATGNYLNHPATFSYFFTPKSQKLYRVDVTFKGLEAYGKAKAALDERFKAPTYSKKDVDHWSWPDSSLVILQKDATDVQISFSSGSLLVLNQKEGEGK